MISGGRAWNEIVDYMYTATEDTNKYGGIARWYYVGYPESVIAKQRFSVPSFQAMTQD